MIRLIDEIYVSEWLQNDEEEPKTPLGHSVLLNFVIRGSRVQYTCTLSSCGASFGRLERALGHVRLHMNHKPYVCNHSCWAENGKCSRRYSDRASLKNHQIRGRGTCPTCSKRLMPQNMARHRSRCRGADSSTKPSV